MKRLMRRRSSWRVVKGGEQLIVDALITYLETDGEQVTRHQRFLELDRGTLPVEALVDKLHRLTSGCASTRPSHHAVPSGSRRGVAGIRPGCPTAYDAC